MIFLFVVPVMAGFGNYFLPLMIGARDMAFPRLNALSFWLLLLGGIVFYITLFFHPPDAGWWSYPPLSETLYSPSGGQDAWIFLIHITGISSLVGAINFYATIVNMRAPGHELGPPAAVRVVDPGLRAPADHRAAGDRRRGDDAAHRPPLRHPLLRPHRPRLAGALAAPVLVLRPPRGLHHDPARVRDHLRGHPGVQPQADLRLQGDRRLHGGDRLPGHAGLGAPHVRLAGPDRRARLLHAQLVPDRRARPGSRSSTGSPRCGAARS